VTNYLVNKYDGQLEGQITIKGSKSIHQRIMILQHLGSTNSLLSNPSSSNDVQIMDKALSKIKSKTTIGASIDIEDAGTPARFLLPILCTTAGKWILEGNSRMSKRPMRGLVEALQGMGMNIEYLSEEGFLPIQIIGQDQELQEHIDLQVDASESSQFASAIALCSTRLAKVLTLRFNNILASKSYFHMTLNLISRFGQEVNWISEKEVQITGSVNLPKDIHIEADWSSMAYWYCLVALSDGAKLEFIKPVYPSDQGDSYVHHFLFAKGLIDLAQTSLGTQVSRSSQSCEHSHIDFSNFPDLAPSLIVTLSALNIPFSFTGVKNLEHKESSRLTIIFKILDQFGIIFKSDGDVWHKSGVFSQAEKTVRVNSHNDHRVAMASALLAMKTDVIIENAEVVKKSYPEFWQDLLKFKFVLDAVE
jgi:3-phosphoshikimate 1-carboxyvinyltransferase